MAHEAQQKFFRKIRDIMPFFFVNKKVLDIGSLDINGSNRYLFQGCDYLGIDLGEGNNVDLVCVAHKFDAPDDYYDVVISGEVFEHDMFYSRTITNAIRMLKPGGLFLFTCASIGRPEHGTRRTSIYDAPFLDKNGDWGDYYKNLTKEDIENINGFTINFPDGIFEYNSVDCDLYFAGIKGGKRYLKYML